MGLSDRSKLKNASKASAPSKISKAGLRRPGGTQTNSPVGDGTSPSVTLGQRLPTKAGLRRPDHGTDGEQTFTPSRTKAGLRRPNPNNRHVETGHVQAEPHSNEEGGSLLPAENASTEFVVNNNSTNNNNTAVVSDRHLAVALPVVDEEEPAGEAQVVDLEILQEKRDQRQRTTRKRAAVGLLVRVVICMAIVLAVVLGIPRAPATSTSQPINDATFTPASMVSASTAPSSAPSSMSNVILDELLLSQLPNFTLASLDDPRSPQTRALEWIRDDWLLAIENVTELADWEIQQIFALASFYYSFQADSSWPKAIAESWLNPDNPNPCNWYSSSYADYDQTTGTYGDATLIDNWGSACNGRGQMMVLQLENIFSNKENHTRTLPTVIPPELSFLTELEDLVLEEAFVGSLNTEIGLLGGALNRLTDLRISDNHFMSGTIPSELFLLSNLYWFYIKENSMLEGSLPSEIGQLRSVRYLELQENALEGTLPTELGLLTRMEFLQLQYNTFTGPVPSEIGQLSSSLFVLNLNDNKFSGNPLPSELGLLQKLDSFYMKRTLQTGRLPSEVGQLQELQYLRLPHNLVSSTLPSELGLIWRKEKQNTLLDDYECHLSHNLITGQIPTELGLVLLNELILSHNLLTGSLPWELGQMPYLEILDLSNNNLSSTLPEALLLGFNGTQYSRLYSLDLSSNSFTGSLPLEIGILTSLSYLNMSFNNMSLSIPPTLGLMTSLRTLDLSFNGFLGSLPTEIGMISPRVRAFNVSYNQLSGVIPSELAVIGSPLSTEICLHGNNFSGGLPHELCPWACQTGRDAAPTCLKQYCMENDGCNCVCSEYWFYWPGRFPPYNASPGVLNINIRFDNSPLETEWTLYHVANNNGSQHHARNNIFHCGNNSIDDGQPLDNRLPWSYKTSQSFDTQFGTTSYTVEGLVPSTRYKLEVTDPDGIDRGWVTLTTTGGDMASSETNHTGTILWDVAGEDLVGTSVVFLWVDDGGQPSLEDVVRK